MNAGHRVSVSRLKLGSLQLVHLPGEPFVEFQLFAQQVAVANSFVCVAGYGECGVWYYWSNNVVLRGSSLARRASEGFTFDNGLPSLARRANC